MVYGQVTWIFVCSIFLAFFVAWGIGANDVANAFSTTVGARALTLKQAVLVASVCEFGGAVLLGSGVTDTIRKGIADISYYEDTPDLLAYGMLCALLSAGLWLALATFLELPVSTTHTIVGAIIGMSMVAKGPDSIIWTSAPDPPDKPFPGGVVSIILAWFITPAMAAIVAALLFLFTKAFVMKAANPYRRSLMLFPLYTYITGWVVTFFVIQKGVNGWMKSEVYTGSPASCPAGATSSKYEYADDDVDETTPISVTGCTIPDGTAAWIAAVTAAVLTLISIISLRWIAKLVERDMRALDKLEEKEASPTDVVSDAENGGKSPESDPNGTNGHAPTRKNRTPEALQAVRRSKIWTKLTSGLNVDVHEVSRTDPKLKAMYEKVEVFDRKSEGSFKYLQVLTACANSFAHGANDVANSIGSFAAIYAIWQCSCATSKSSVPIWMFVIGGAGIVVGLATFGYNIMRALGVRMTKLSNSRGYCAELTSAIIVIISSRYGFPVSTTQVITGAITGIGLEEVISAKLAHKPHPAGTFNFLLLLKFFAGWIATLVIAALTAAAFTAQGIFAPNKTASENVARQGTEINWTSTLIAEQLGAEGEATNNQTLIDQSETILNETSVYADEPFLNLNEPLATLNQSLEYYAQATTWVS